MKHELITVRNYAEKVKLQPATIYAQIKRGELPFKKIDGVLFVLIKHAVK